MISHSTIHKMIIEKLGRRYEETGLKNLRTNNEKLHTVVYEEPNVNWRLQWSKHFNIPAQELPIMHCRLENGNLFLMTTGAIYSFYEGKVMSMPYAQYDRNDRSYFHSSQQLYEGKTVTFQYFAKDGAPLKYEIDSFYPADAAHAAILTTLRNGWNSNWVANEKPAGR